MRGILSLGAYLPHRRLDRTTIAAVAGLGGGKGTRTVASFDEDTTTLGVEAARLALRAAPGGVTPAVLSFSTVAPAYLDKTNATAVHAALQLPDEVLAYDAGGAVRSAVAALRLALDSDRPTLVVSADVRTGLPGSAEEAGGGDGAAAVLTGIDADGPVLAELLGASAVSDEFLDRWRTPGDTRSRTWEERFGELRYVPLGREAYKAGLAAAGVAPDEVARVIVTSPHTRAATACTKQLGLAEGVAVDTLAATVGWTGAAHPALLLAATLEELTAAQADEGATAPAAGQVVVLLSLADGADCLVFRTTEALTAWVPARPVLDQAAAGAPVPYGKFLAWRGMLTPEPPRRPEPARPSASAAGRSEDWKFGFVGAQDRATGAVHLPPQRVSAVGGAVDAMDPIPMADRHGTIVTFTVDKLAYSPSPPIVFAVVDFDGGGRLPIELTDVEPGAVAIGDRVEMTFRRLFTADGIHNYFWKARPVRA